MKQQKKSIPVKKEAPFGGPLKVLIAGFVILVLFFVFYGRNTTPKITPEGAQTSVCSTESFPVCGKDGKTYLNSCTAEKIANVRVASVGACSTEETGSIDAITTTETGSEVDSGIENIGPVPKYESDRTDTGTMAPSNSESSWSTSTLSGITVSASGIVDPTLVTYTNNTYHYSFSMPKNSYYQAFGAQNGANHSVGIATGTGVDSLSGSEVRVYFYANKIVGKLAGADNGFYTDSTTGTVYILLNNKDSIAIESSSSDSTLVQTIVRTIHEE